ncbi:hypothetical protein BVIET440_50340 [Burkholderia vietnamiensis]
MSHRLIYLSHILSQTPNTPHPIGSHPYESDRLAQIHHD